GRPAELPGVQDMVGMFINTIPTRVGIHSGQSVAGWLRELQAGQSEARRFEFVALSQLQAYSDLPAGTGLFESMIVFENYPFDETAGEGGFRVTEVAAADTTNFALSLRAYLDDVLVLDLGYDPTLFDESTVDRMIRHLGTLLAGIAAHSDRPLR